jgi:TetR/AcrR family transcriptional regulator, mexJK operon transcriptional repressor
MRRTADVVVLETAKKLGRPKVRSDEEQRDIILSRAMEMFLESGFIATRMDDLAGSCRISKRTLYRFFPSKLDLFAALVNAHRCSMVDFPPGLDELTLEAALLQVFRVELDPEEDFRRMLFVQRTLADARAVPELGDILHNEGGQRAKRLLAEWLAKRKCREQIGSGDPTHLAAMLMDLVFGAIAIKPVTTSYWPGGSDRKAYLKNCIRYFANGIREVAGKT